MKIMNINDYWDDTCRTFVHDLYGWDVYVNYGEKGFNQSNIARNANPLKDKELSELLWDLLCVTYSRFYAESGDISEATYEKDREYFKTKWLKRSHKQRIKDEIDKHLTEARDQLYYELLVDKDDNNN